MSSYSLPPLFFFIKTFFFFTSLFLAFFFFFFNNPAPTEISPLSLHDPFPISLWEGLALVSLEAMAAGLPVVATRVSAVPEAVVDGETGLLVPPRDPSSLAGALRRLAEDPALRERLGRAGRARVRERFGLERMIEETLAVYRESKGEPS